MIPSLLCSKPLSRRAPNNTGERLLSVQGLSFSATTWHRHFQASRGCTNLNVACAQYGVTVWEMVSGTTIPGSPLAV